MQIYIFYLRIRVQRYFQMMFIKIKTELDFVIPQKVINTFGVQDFDVILTKYNKV